MSEPRFPFVAVDVEPDESDELSGELFDLGAQGVEERDATTLVKGAAGKVTLVASFETHEQAHAAIAALHARGQHGARLEEVVGDAWRDAWKEHFRPFEIAPGVVIRPPWEPYSGHAKHVLELEPGRAFGTGLHETTSLVAGVLAAHGGELAAREVLDVGTGSGILALVALALGASNARATDIDREAIDVTRENAARNHLESRVVADTTPIEEVLGTWPFVLANIEARVLIPMAPTLAARVAPDGLLVLSGILVPQKDDVVAAYEAVGGLRLLDAPVKGEWIALVFRRGVP